VRIRIDLSLSLPDEVMKTLKWISSCTKRVLSVMDVEREWIYIFQASLKCYNGTRVVHRGAGFDPTTLHI
jgi:hypothetical protein